jgi:hypothetical protein
MKLKTWLSLILLAACCAPLSQTVGAQEPGSRLSAARVKSKTAVVLVENDQRRDYVDLYTKTLKGNPQGLKVDPKTLRAALPDLIIADVRMTTDAKTSKQKWYIRAENKGALKSASCNLRFLYGSHLLDAGTLEIQDFAVPAIEAGKSAMIYFEPPHKAVNWWVFAINYDPAHPQIKETTQANNVYIIELEN